MVSTRTSPPTQRVVAVLDHMLSHAGSSFGLSELARTLDISRPTLLGILTTLTEHGYLACDPVTRAYSIGPALVAAGRDARSAMPAADVAAVSLEPLATTYGVACAVSGVIGNDIVVLGGVDPDTGNVPRLTGLRYPCAPPIGIEYVLWDGDEALDRWLAKAPARPAAADRARLRRLVDECRSRGYLVEELTELGARVYRLLAEVPASTMSDTIRSLVGEGLSISGERVYLEDRLATRGILPTNVVAAPTYDAQGHQELLLTMHVAAPTSTTDLRKRGKALVAVAADVTSRTGGSAPTW